MSVLLYCLHILQAVLEVQRFRDFIVEMIGISVHALASRMAMGHGSLALSSLRANCIYTGTAV